jgi:hypothetical protein
MGTAVARGSLPEMFIGAKEEQSIEAMALSFQSNYTFENFRNGF